jgi:CheY-like chemotaxis protein
MISRSEKDFGTDLHNESFHRTTGQVILSSSGNIYFLSEYFSGKTRQSRGIMAERSILIVEDEGLIALHLMEILANAGYSVREPVPSGEDALRHVERTPPPDLILMDITLDGQLDGIETATRIRERYNIPVIFLTAHSNDTIIHRAKDASPCGYIIKPVIEKELLAHVEKALNQKKG